MILRLFPLCITVLFLSACTPPVVKLEVQPELICAECTDVTLEWEIQGPPDEGEDGTAVLTATPTPASGLPAVTTLTGRAAVNICESTVFDLSLSRPDLEDTETALASVTVLPPYGEIRTFQLQPICDRGAFRGWSGDGMSEDFSSLIRVRNVTMTGRSLVTLNHDSVESPIRAGISSNAWDNTSAIGSWFATGILNPGEGCPVDGATFPGPQPDYPGAITLTVQLGCNP